MTRRLPTTLAAALGLALLWSASTSEAGIDLRIICQPCENAEQCGDHTDFCLIYPGVGDFCGMHCLTDDDCFGLSCQPVDADGLSNCVDIADYCRNGLLFECSLDGHCDRGQLCEGGHCVDTGGQFGDACEGDEDCAEGTDTCRETELGWLCTRSCDWLTPAGADCPEGFFCDESEGCADGVCVPGAAGEGLVGDGCTSDTDCIGLLCADFGAEASQCSEPCEPGGESCGDGARCVARGTGCGGCVAACVVGDCGPLEFCAAGICEALRLDGAPCQEARECASGICQSLTCGDNSNDDDPPNSDGGVDDGRLTTSCNCRVATPTASTGRTAGLLCLVVGLALLVRRHRRSL